MDFEEFDPERISPEVIGLSRERWEQLLIQLQKNGYIEGLNIRQYIRQTPHILPPVCPRITLKGLEYLHENSIMQKMKAAAARNCWHCGQTSSPKTILIVERSISIRGAFFIPIFARGTA